MRAGKGAFGTGMLSGSCLDNTADLVTVVKACSGARTLAGVTAEVDSVEALGRLSSLPSASRGRSVVLRCSRLPSCFLSKAQEEGISLSAGIVLDQGQNK